MAGVGFPSPQHPTSTHNGDDDDENVKQLQECAHVYQCLQDCLIKTDRNWKACQSDRSQSFKSVPRTQVQAIEDI
ncbi:hypothetical protein O6H91_06G065200 [Diphasiastrum complanatum]|uniref:Uncharacterized protein n=1 Tax=Diphasiastrum complanatum TaxID=34168 RepID=A0ACC2DEK9_DIPCM|nr:hypothetical protein O6H91_06G065200 [Diphasiastrum complanatum]